MNRMGEPRITAEILLVEDNQSDLELALRALGKHRISDVCVARDGLEALDFIFCQGPFSARSIADQPRVVLLDLKLPLIDGIEVLRRIRADSRTHSIPIVALTSSDREADVALMYQLGVNSYIRKPTDFNQFADAIKMVGAYWLTVNQPLLSGSKGAMTPRLSRVPAEARYRQSA